MPRKRRKPRKVSQQKFMKFVIAALMNITERQNADSSEIRRLAKAVGYVS